MGGADEEAATDMKATTSVTSEGKDPVVEPVRLMGSFSWTVLCTSMLVAVSQVALDVTITANLQPVILTTFGEIRQLPWVNVTYSLANAGSSLMWGKLYDVHDNRKIFLASRVVFVAGSVITGAAPSMGALIAGKAITGLGGSGTYIGSIAIISSLTTSEERPWYFSYIGVMWGIGTIIGPILAGGFSVTQGGWRWSFYFDAILGGVAIPALAFLLPPLYRRQKVEQSWWGHLRRVDVCGNILFASALVSTVMAFAFAGTTYAWASGQVISLFIVTAFLWAVFAAQQITATFTTETDRVLPVHVLRAYEMWVLSLQVLCPFGVLFTTINYVPLYLQFVRGESPLKSAIDMFPLLIFTVASMLASGRIVTNYGPYKLWFLIGSALTLTASGLWYHVTVSTDHAYLYGAMILGGTGIGLYGMSPGPIMAAKVPAAFAGDTGTIFGCSDVLSGAIPVAIANTIFTNSATSAISDIFPDEPIELIQEAIAGVGTSFVDNLQPDQKELVLQAVTSAIRNVWIQTIATAAFSFLLSFCMRTESVKKIRKIPITHEYAS